MLLTFWNQSIIIGCGLHVGKCNLKIQDLFDIRKKQKDIGLCAWAANGSRALALVLGLISLLVERLIDTTLKDIGHRI